MKCNQIKKKQRRKKTKLIFINQHYNNRILKIIFIAIICFVNSKAIFVKLVHSKQIGQMLSHSAGFRRPIKFWKRAASPHISAEGVGGRPLTEPLDPSQPNLAARTDSHIIFLHITYDKYLFDSFFFRFDITIILCTFLVNIV